MEHREQDLVAGIIKKFYTGLFSPAKAYVSIGRKTFIANKESLSVSAPHCPSYCWNSKWHTFKIHLISCSLKTAIFFHRPVTEPNYGFSKNHMLETFQKKITTTEWPESEMKSQMKQPLPPNLGECKFKSWNQLPSTFLWWAEYCWRFQNDSPSRVISRLAWFLLVHPFRLLFHSPTPLLSD